MWLVSFFEAVISRCIFYLEHNMRCPVVLSGTKQDTLFATNKQTRSVLTIVFPAPLSSFCCPARTHGSASWCWAQDGRLAAGDQLLSVDGRSLVGLSQERYHSFLCFKCNFSMCRDRSPYSLQLEDEK